MRFGNARWVHWAAASLVCAKIAAAQSPEPPSEPPAEPSAPQAPPAAQPMPPPPAPPPGYAPPPGQYPPPGYAPPPGYYPPPPGYYPPGYYPPPRASEPSPQELPPEAKPRDDKARGYHLHDGYFMRFAGGVGYLDLSLEFDALGGAEVDSRGGGLAWQFDFGGALADGVVMGAGYHGVVATDPEVDGATSASSASASFLMLGGFVSVFPDPRGGLELGGMLALALAEQTAADPFGDAGTVETDFLAGPGVALWAGYAGWVSANWAIGGLVRASAGWMSGTTQSIQTSGVIAEADTRATARSIALCFNAVYQ